MHKGLDAVARRWRQFVITGWIIISGWSASCVAQTALILQDDKSFTTLHSSDALHPIFQNLYPYQKFIFTVPQKNGILPLNEFKTQLRKVLVLQLSENIVIGIDKFKVKPFDVQKNQMVENENYLQQNNKSTSIARGYGLELKIKL